MKELTRAEEEIMQILWEIEKGFVNDVVARMPEPKPAYNTVSTIIRILEKKGFVDHEAFGKTHQYFPVISKEHYTKGFLSSFVKKYFSNSYQQMVSFFSKEEDLSLKDMEEINKIIQHEIELKKGKDDE